MGRAGRYRMNRKPDTSQGYVVLTGWVEPEDHLFVSHCPELGVASCGDTAGEALDNLGEALAVHLEALAEIGELEQSQSRKSGSEAED